MSGNMFDLDVQVSKVNDMVEPNTITPIVYTLSKCVSNCCGNPAQTLTCYHTQDPCAYGGTAE